VVVDIAETGLFSYRIRRASCNGTFYTSKEDIYTKTTTSVLLFKNQTTFIVDSFNKKLRRHSFQIFSDHLVQPRPNNISEVASFFRERRLKRLKKMEKKRASIQCKYNCQMELLKNESDEK